MEIFKNNNQKDNVARYCFDISKILSAVIVITPLVKEGLSSPYLAIGGVFAAMLFFLIGYFLDGKEV